MNEISEYYQGLHEECGVFGIYDKTGETDMVSAVYSALYALQHRGQESCGIALNVDGVLSGYRDLGLVSEVFTKRVLEELPQGAKMATGHVRYATAGQRSRSNAHPMILHHCKGAMAVCHNGNLVNASQLRRKLEMSGSIFHGTSDTEVIAYLLTQNRLVTPNIEMAVSRTMDDIEGAYSLVIMTHTKLIAARDPNGYSLAWMHHKGRNRHHFEYWTDLSPVTRTYEPVDMPVRYLCEMVADRIAACKTYQGAAYTDASALQYLDRAQESRLVHPNTMKRLRFLLTMLAEQGEPATFRFMRQTVLKGKPFAE